MSESLASQIASAAGRAQSIAVDGQSVNERPLSELIAADKYLRSLDALDNDHSMGLRFATQVPPGPLGGHRS